MYVKRYTSTRSLVSFTSSNVLQVTTVPAHAPHIHPEDTRKKGHNSRTPNPHTNHTCVIYRKEYYHALMHSFTYITHMSLLCVLLLCLDTHHSLFSIAKCDTSLPVWQRETPLPEQVPSAQRHGFPRLQ